jgi:hypothetical protein
MRVRLRLPRPVGLVLLIALLGFFGYWYLTRVGSAGELRPSSSMRILFPIWSSTAWDTVGYVWASEGDTIVLNYDIALESGWFSLTVGKKRWFFRRLLRHEQTRAFRQSAAGQVEYPVREAGLHAIWAGRYSVWRGEARVRWTLRRGAP